MQPPHGGRGRGAVGHHTASHDCGTSGRKQHTECCCIFSYRNGARCMPERDVYHQVVIRALQKDGWEITHDPLTLRLGDARLYVDLGAEKLIEATKQGRYIAVEIKSFTGASFFAELHTALGQFLSYHTALALLASDRVLYLAVPLDTYEAYFTTPFAQTILDQAPTN